MLASLERTSEHPLARAVVRYAEEKLDPSYLKSNPLVEPTMFRALTGRGASGTIQGKVSVAVGNRSFASVLGLTIPPQAEVCMKRLEEQGKTAILVAVNESICAVIGIADELKADAAESIVYLKEVMGVDVWMVTGDNRRQMRSVANSIYLPIGSYQALQLPKCSKFATSGRSRVGYGWGRLTIPLSSAGRHWNEQDWG
jgi:Cu+-exporting ATPase